MAVGYRLGAPYINQVCRHAPLEYDWIIAAIALYRLRRLDFTWNSGRDAQGFGSDDRTEQSRVLGIGPQTPAYVGNDPAFDAGLGIPAESPIPDIVYT
jgi:hypothetical protein